MKIIRSFGFAWNGIRDCFLTQVNFRIHLLLTVLAILLAIVLHISTTEWLFVLLCIANVLLAEMVNTAIEKLCDMVEKNFHPTIKLVKDISAGAVLVTALMSLITGIIIFLPKLFILIKSL